MCDRQYERKNRMDTFAVWCYTEISPGGDIFG